MGSISVTIDGLRIESSEGATILELAKAHGIYIPAVCAHSEESPFACKLCVVEVEGRTDLPVSCQLPAAHGMVVRTHSPRLNQMRKKHLKRLLAEHPGCCLNCPRVEPCDGTVCQRKPDYKERCVTCPKNGKCDLQKAARSIKMGDVLYPYAAPNRPVWSDDPFYERNYNLCINCGQCVAACKEIVGVGALAFAAGPDGKGRVAARAGENHFRESDCRFCGVCVEVCPTGTLTDKMPYEEPPCRHACPAGVDVSRYVRLIAEGRYDESYAVVREKLPLPSVCGYICLSFCESECRRGKLNEPVSIRALKRFVSENHTDLWKRNLKPPVPTGKKVAILGSGPAGLTAGYYLARKGHAVTIFEQSSVPGGLLRHTISRRRLPGRALEEDIEEILKAGVRLELNGPRMSLVDLKKEGFDAIFLGIGSTFVGPGASWLRKEGLDLNPQGGIRVDPVTLATSQEGVFAGGDAVLEELTEDFVDFHAAGSGAAGGSDSFYSLLVNQMALHRGDTDRSAIRAIGSGKKAAESIDRYLGGDGAVEERLLEPDQPRDGILGRVEGFAELKRLSPAYQPPPPQYAGLRTAEAPLNNEEARSEARRCQGCDIRKLLNHEVPVKAKEKETLGQNTL